ncbi:outer membrane protein assembly factor BamA [Candidatus Latescibacterota bacterium]
MKKIHLKPILLILFIQLFAMTFSQNAITQPVNIIREITIRTNRESDPNVDDVKQLVKDQCGLKIGSPISSENVANAIRILWGINIFDDVQVYQKLLENGLEIIIQVSILPQINSIITEGFEEYKEEEILAAIKIIRGNVIGERRIATLEKIITDLYDEKGFLAAEMNFEMTPLTADSTKVDLKITIDEGKKTKLRSINIVGNEEISDKKIKKLMETKENRWYRSGEFKEEVYEEDKKTIIALYKTSGYRDATVYRDSLFTDEERENNYLTMFIQEGQQYKFGKTTIEGNTFFTDEELFAKIRYEEGDTFNDNEKLISIYGTEAQWGYDGIITLYNDAGYLKTYINPVDLVRGDSIDVFIDIAEGLISNIGKVNIDGNTKTIEKVIRREISLNPGEPFNRSKLDRSKRDVMALNFFQDVNYDYIPREDSEDVDLLFTVSEKQTGVASMGAGYSERDKLVGSLSFSNQNLFGNGQSISFNWEQGTRRKRFDIGFGEPWLFDTPTSFYFNIYDMVRSDYTTAFDQEKRRGATLRFGRRLKWPDFSSAYLTYRIEDIDYSNASSYYSNYLITGKTSSFSFNFIRDSRDLPQFATEGGRTSATVEIAGGPLGGDLSYYRYLLNNEIHTPIFWKISLLLRTKIGFLKGYKESRFVPYSERFMPGGISYDGIVRGYPNRQVSPRLQGEEIGGETMLVNNIELQIPVVAQTLYGILFYDFGNAWRDLSETNPFDAKRSAGVGARVYIPGMGLMGFDIGYGFDKIEGSDRVGGWRTHFQFGQQW